MILRHIPMCARCGHEVDSVSMIGTEDGNVLLGFACHGDRDHVPIPLPLAQTRTIELMVTVAFRDRRADLEAIREDDDPEAVRRRAIPDEIAE